MKKIALFSLFVVCFKFSVVFSQDSIPVKKDRKFLYGLNVSGSLSYFVGVSTNFSAVITTNSRYRHSIYFGSMLNSPYNGVVKGIQGGYMFFPNLKQKRFNFHFFYDVKHERYSRAKSLWQHMIGYGFRFNIISNLYANNNIGVGNTYVKTKEYPGILDEYNYFSGVFNIGIGYNF